MDQSADELGAGALHTGDDVSNVISSGLIKVGRDWTFCSKRLVFRVKGMNRGNDFQPVMAPLRSVAVPVISAISHLAA